MFMAPSQRLPGHDCTLRRTIPIQSIVKAVPTSNDLLDDLGAAIGGHCIQEVEPRLHRLITGERKRQAVRDQAVLVHAGEPRQACCQGLHLLRRVERPVVSVLARVDQQRAAARHRQLGCPAACHDLHGRAASVGLHRDVPRTGIRGDLLRAVGRELALCQRHGGATVHALRLPDRNQRDSRLRREVGGDGRQALGAGSLDRAPKIGRAAVLIFVGSDVATNTVAPDVRSGEILEHRDNGLAFRISDGVESLVGLLDGADLLYDGMRRIE